jgi:predicted TIM-barrel fold metal-dependent hydrolase
MPTQEDVPPLFIDSHCHLFNILDVPLYESLEGVVNKDTIYLLLGSFGAPVAVAAGVPHTLLSQNRNFIKFFERDTRANISWFASQIKTAIHDDVFKTIVGSDSISRIIITPLLMDFDSCIKATDLGPDAKSCKDQFKRLKDTILECSDCGIEIYPFMGFGLNQLHRPDSLQKLQEWWREFGYSKEDRIKGLHGPLRQSGKAIGIKLYPPLGFNPCPEPLPQAYLEFYGWCNDNDIPLAVHCQESSYCANEDQKKKCHTYTHPENWRRLFSRHPELNTLRLNFGHFGGESQISRLVSYGDNDIATSLNQSSWSYIIYELLDRCPNIYADLAAYDYSKQAFQESLGKLLAGSADALSGGERISEVLRKKLIWGSDVPMIISTPSFVEDDKASYLRFLQGFILSLDDNPLSGSQANLRKEICQAVMRTNPARFLFGSSS